MKKYLFLFVILFTQTIHAQFINTPRYPDGDSVVVHTIYRGTTTTLLLETTDLDFLTDWNNGDPITIVLEDTTANHSDIPVTVEEVDSCTFNSTECVRLNITIPETARYGEWRFKTYGTSVPTVHYYAIAIIEQPIVR
jgi:hypothetical protein